MNVWFVTFYKLPFLNKRDGARLMTTEPDNRNTQHG